MRRKKNKEIFSRRSEEATYKFIEANKSSKRWWEHIKSLFQTDKSNVHTVVQCTHTHIQNYLTHWLFQFDTDPISHLIFHSSLATTMTKMMMIMMMTKRQFSSTFYNILAHFIQLSTFGVVCPFACADFIIALMFCHIWNFVCVSGCVCALLQIISLF